ncbi:hypothetical protein ACV22V_31855 [Burkholderia sp. AW33-5]
MSGLAKRTGEKVANAAKSFTAAAEPKIAFAAASGYELWAGDNALAAGGGLAAAIGGGEPTLDIISTVTRGVAVLPSTLDGLSSLVGFERKAEAYSTARRGFKEATPSNRLAAKDAQSTKKQAAGNLARATPGAIRDAGIGAVNQVSRIYTTAAKHSLFGTPAQATVGSAALLVASGATYVAGAAMLSNKVDRAVDRTQALRSAILHPLRGRGEENGDSMQELDEIFANGGISSNIYSILRMRHESDIGQFLDNFRVLGQADQRRFAKVMHFSGERNVAKALDLRRSVILNTASMRRSAREEILDAFIEADVQPDSTADLFTKLKAVRCEALGGKAAPIVAETRTFLQDAGIGPEEFDTNSLRAIASSGEAKVFVDRYRTLPQDDRARLNSVLHFGSWRFWKRDATLQTTKYQRSDIRAALIRKFANGATLDHLEAAKIRYNQKIVPLQAGRTHLRLTPENSLKMHILARQDTVLDSLKEEKRHAKIQMAYGTANAALGVAELAINPLAASRISAAQAVLSPFYYAYAGRRGVVNWLNEKNARPVNASMREEAVLCALPQIRSLIVSGGAIATKILDYRQFLRDELGLSDKEIGKIEKLERSGDFDGARAILAQQSPQASALIAMRILAEECAGHGTDAQRHDALDFIAREATRSNNASLQRIRSHFDPERTYETLKAHFIDDVSFDPEAMRDALTHSLSNDATANDFGLDGESYADLPKRYVASDLLRRFSQENPSFAIRLFVSDLFSDGEQVTAAQNMLRDLRFEETEISQLRGMKKPQAATWLEKHLFGENLRRRFSSQTLDRDGRSRALQVAVRIHEIPARCTDTSEPLMWRRDLEASGLAVIDNPGKSGLDSMLYALGQHFSGKTDSTSSSTSRRVMEARKRVMAELAGGELRRHIDVTGHRDAIVRIAAECFGKPGAVAAILDVTGDRMVRHAGAGRKESVMSVDAVLCYDAQTQRTFALHGGDIDMLPPRIQAMPQDGDVDFSSGVNQ